MMHEHYINDDDIPQSINLYSFIFLAIFGCRSKCLIKQQQQLNTADKCSTMFTC